MRRKPVTYPFMELRARDGGRTMKYKFSEIVWDKSHIAQFWRGHKGKHVYGRLLLFVAVVVAFVFVSVFVGDGGGAAAVVVAILDSLF